MPHAAFLALSFFLFLAPTSSIIPSADLMFEHRLYLPLIPGSVLIAWTILALFFKVSKSRRLQTAVTAAGFLVLLTSFAVLTKGRTFVWGDQIRLWQEAVEKAPWNSRAYYNLGVAYLLSDKERARAALKKAVEIQPNHTAALYNLGWIEQKVEHFDLAARHYAEALETDPNFWRAHQNLGNLLVIQGRFEDARTHYGQVIRIQADYWPAYESLAILQLQHGDAASALQTILKLRQLEPERHEALFLHASSLVELRRFQEAEAEFRSLEKLDVSNRFRGRITHLRSRMSSDLRNDIR
jgi:tetratricopeptide (TPR) repeat protein